MSGYVGYLGKYRHSSDSRHAADIRRASAEHQGLIYQEPAFTSSKSHAGASFKNTSHVGNQQSPAEGSRVYPRKMATHKTKQHAKQASDVWGDESAKHGGNAFDEPMGFEKPAQPAAVDCNIVYKKTRKISMKNFNS